MTKYRAAHYLDSGYLFFMVFFLFLFSLFVPLRLSAAVPEQQDELLQFTADSHVVGFQTNGISVASGDHLLKVDFVGTSGVKPVSDNAARGDIMTQSLSRVVYSDLWSGVTLSYTDVPDGIVESIWQIAPGVDVAQIRLRYNASIEIEANGILKVSFDTGWMSESAPIAWQQIDGHSVPVQVAFKKIETLNGEMIVGFDLGQYNPAHPLLIDPVLQWNTFVGSAVADQGHAIAIDDAGNTYVVGHSWATWGGEPVNDHTVGSGLYADVFVAKLNAAGVLQWNTFMGRVDSHDEGRGVALDLNGNVYVTGFSAGSWGSPLNSHAGQDDVFVAKLNGSGVLQWSTFLGSNLIEHSRAIAVDSTGNSYVTGFSDSSWGTPKNDHSGSRDIFAAKLDTDGALQWNTFWGAAGADYGNAIALDGARNVYLVGYGPSSWGSPINGHAGADDVFAAKLDTDGVLQWNTFLGSSSTDQGYGVAVDGSANVYVAALGWVAGLNARGEHQWYSSFDAEGHAIAVDGPNVYVAGDGRTSWGAPLNDLVGGRDIFAAKMDSSTGALQCNTFMGSASDEFGTGIAVDGANVHVVGYGYDWGSPINGYAGSTDAFVARIVLSCYTASTSISAGEGSLLPFSRTVSDGDSTTFTANADVGYTINTVTGCGGTWTGSNPYTTGAVTADCAVEASFSIITNTVSALVDEHGSLDGTSAVVDHGSTASFTVTPDIGYSTDPTVGGDCPAGSWNGLTYTTGIITDACTVSFTNTITNYTVTPLSGSPGSLIAAGLDGSLALRSDGTVASFGGSQLAAPSGLSDVVAVAAGNNHGLALKNDGTVVTWGYDGFGLADVPADLSGVKAVAGGQYHSLALKNDGTVAGWGRDDWGQATAPAGLTDAVAIAGGESHSLALKGDGTVIAWGNDSRGQSTVPDGLTGVVAVAASRENSLALRNDGTLVVWGRDIYDLNIVPAGLENVVAVAAGDFHILALKNDGTVVAWGYNGLFQSTVPTGLSDVVAVAAGGNHSLALKSDGTIVAWGSNASEESTVPGGLNLIPFYIGHGTISPDTPQTLAAGSTVQYTMTPEAGYSTSVGGTCGGTLNGNTYTTNSLIADCTVEVLFVINSYAVSATIDQNGKVDSTPATVIHGASASYTVTPDTGYFVNTNVGGDCAAGSWNGSTYTTGVITGACSVEFATLKAYVVTPSPGSAASLISGGGHHTLVLPGDGTVLVWGANNWYGQTNVPAGLTGVEAVSAGFAHSLALKNDDTVIGWGVDKVNLGTYPNYGQTIVPIGLSGVVEVSAGGFHSLALKSDGMVVAWGRDDFGQIAVPVGLSSVVTVSAGSFHSLALKSDGTVVAWGNNASFQSTVPTGLTDVVAVAAGGNHSLALKGDGTVVAWGYNGVGQTTVPEGLTDVVAVSAGTSHSLALKGDGTVAAWGSNVSGQTSVPAGLTGVIAVSAGADHCLALKSNGTVVAWGIIGNDLSAVLASLNLLPFPGAYGTISPNTHQFLAQGSTTQFTVMANSGYTAHVIGTCGGALVGNTYTTNAIVADCTVIANFGEPGDVYQNGTINLFDAVLALQVLAGIVPADTVTTTADVNGDGMIGLAEVVYVLNAVAGFPE